jgi:hypothetical protein
MLQMDPDKVCFIVVKMREYEEEDLIEEEEPKPREVDLAHEEEFEELDEHELADDPIKAELVAFIDQLPDEEQVELVSLAWLGRGDYEVEEWEDILKAAEERANKRTAQYLLGMPLLADYLEEGLDAFDLSCTDFDESRL